MVKISGPVMSDSASGQFAKRLTFSQRRSGQQVRQFHQPKKRLTNEQAIQRKIISGLVAYWRTFTTAQKAVYNLLAIDSGEKITGFNLYIRLACADLKTHYGLIGYWPAEEESGTTVFDKSGNSANITLYGNATRVEGRIGKCVQYESNNGWGDSRNVDLSKDMTWCAWVKQTRLTTWAAVVSQNVIEVNARFLVRFITRQLYCYWRTTKHEMYHIGAVGTAEPFRWYHLAVTINNTTRKMTVYKNGVDANVGVTYATGNVAQATGKCNHARDSRGVHYWQGVIDDERIYERVVSASEIKKIYSLGCKKFDLN